mmetsp:Transcript_106696/g.340550  ORF Transcript_106696/g.340550 Transcript_106696/m.340550 type:complete len:509 (+) Transcript_106696:1520-3046(+)
MRLQLLSLDIQHAHQLVHPRTGAEVAGVEGLPLAAGKLQLGLEALDGARQHMHLLPRGRLDVLEAGLEVPQEVGVRVRRPHREAQEVQGRDGAGLEGRQRAQRGQVEALGTLVALLDSVVDEVANTKYQVEQLAELPAGPRLLGCQLQGLASLEVAAVQRCVREREPHQSQPPDAARQSAKWHHLLLDVAELLKDVLVLQQLLGLLGCRQHRHQELQVLNAQQWVGKVQVLQALAQLPRIKLQLHQRNGQVLSASCVQHRNALGLLDDRLPPPRPAGLGLIGLAEHGLEKPRVELRRARKVRKDGLSIQLVVDRLHPVDTPAEGGHAKLVVGLGLRHRRLGEKTALAFGLRPSLGWRALAFSGGLAHCRAGRRRRPLRLALALAFGIVRLRFSICSVRCCGGVGRGLWRGRGRTFLPLTLAAGSLRLCPIGPGGRLRAHCGAVRGHRFGRGWQRRTFGLAFALAWRRCGDGHTIRSSLLRCCIGGGPAAGFARLLGRKPARVVCRSGR